MPPGRTQPAAINRTSAVDGMNAQVWWTDTRKILMCGLRSCVQLAVAGWPAPWPSSNWWIKSARYEDNEVEATMTARLKLMATSPLNRVIQHFLADFGPDGGGMTDGELLARFLSSRDDNALAALVRRHAPMVWGVCCRLLHNHHDAEDAFQATFLVLVRKAADVPRQAVANWLYGVARQTAVRLRATAAKRGRRETQVVNMPEPTVAEVRDADLQSVLDEELSRLPDHYRGVIVLCDLEGMTRKEAARQLGIPEGSVASRLARARVLLAKRLTRRGVVFSGGSVAAVLSAGSASAVRPARSGGVHDQGRKPAGGGASGGRDLGQGRRPHRRSGENHVRDQDQERVGGGAGRRRSRWCGGADLPAQAAEPPKAKEEQPADKKDQKKGEEKNATTWQERAPWEGHLDKVNRLAFAPDGKTLASASDDSTVKVWNLATGKELVGVKEPDGSGVRGVAFAPDGKTFATAGGDKAVRLWDAEKGTQIQQFGGHTGATYCVVFSPDGKTLVSGGGSANYPDKGQTGYGEIRLWDPTTGKERTSVQSHTWPVAHLAFTPDGKTLISGGYDNTIKLWDWDGKAQPQERLTITVGQGQGIYDMALSPDGKTLVVASEGAVKLWDVATGKEGDTALEKSEYRDGLMRISVALRRTAKLWLQPAPFRSGRTTTRSSLSSAAATSCCGMSLRGNSARNCAWTNPSRR